MDQEKQKKVDAREIQPKPGKLMPDVDFWPLIENLDWNKTGDDDDVIAPVIQLVAKLRKNLINQFEETLSHKLFLLDTEAHARQIGVSSFTHRESHFSVDEFLYARCAAVAKGRAFYENALADPAKMPKDIEFEALLSICRKARLLKTGDEDSDFTPKCSYETFSNKDGWKTSTP